MGAKKRSGKKSIYSTERGTDASGKEYKTLTAMWTEAVGAVPLIETDTGLALAETTTAAPATAAAATQQAGLGSKSGWYSLGAGYWGKVDPTVDGMLGGFASLSPVDVKESTEFLQSVRKLRGAAAFEFGYALGVCLHYIILLLQSLCCACFPS